MTNAMEHTFLCYQSLDKLLREKLDQMFCSFLFGCLFYYWFVRVLWEQFFWKQEKSFVVWVVFDSTFRNLNIRFSQKSVTQVLTNLSREVSLRVGKFSLKLSRYKAFSWSLRQSLFPPVHFMPVCQVGKAWSSHWGLEWRGQWASGQRKRTQWGDQGGCEVLRWDRLNKNSWGEASSEKCRAVEASWVRWAGAWRIGVSPAKRNAFA